jgi:hypothetical protein
MSRRQTRLYHSPGGNDRIEKRELACLLRSDTPTAAIMYCVLFPCFMRFQHSEIVQGNIKKHGCRCSYTRSSDHQNETLNGLRNCCGSGSRLPLAELLILTSPAATGKSSISDSGSTFPLALLFRVANNTHTPRRRPVHRYLCLSFSLATAPSGVRYRVQPHLSNQVRMALLSQNPLRHSPEPL